MTILLIVNNSIGTSRTHSGVELSLDFGSFILNIAPGDEDVGPFPNSGTDICDLDEPRCKQYYYFTWNMQTTP